MYMYYNIPFETLWIVYNIMRVFVGLFSSRKQLAEKDVYLYRVYITKNFLRFLTQTGGKSIILYMYIQWPSHLVRARDKMAASKHPSHPFFSPIYFSIDFRFPLYLYNNNNMLLTVVSARTPRPSEMLQKYITMRVVCV